mmetsp:Transcript_560/g.1540  ORF Transcript_560/g.1540 Transcript_560/m.1540 type:complete len:285 (-) Transcript_560:603-1457(-)
MNDGKIGVHCSAVSMHRYPLGSFLRLANGFLPEVSIDLDGDSFAYLIQFVLLPDPAVQDCVHHFFYWRHALVIKRRGSQRTQASKGAVLLRVVRLVAQEVCAVCLGKTCQELESAVRSVRPHHFVPVLAPWEIAEIRLNRIAKLLWNQRWDVLHVLLLQASLRVHVAQLEPHYPRVFGDDQWFRLARARIWLHFLDRHSEAVTRDFPLLCSIFFDLLQLLFKRSDLGMNRVNLRRADARFLRRLPQFSQPHVNDSLFDANLYVLSLYVLRYADPLVNIAVIIQK